MTSTLPNDNIRNFDDQITNKLISEIIRDRIKNSGTRFSANDNIADFINPGELEILEKEVASRVKDLLKSLVIDVENDHNTQETAERVSKMYLNEVLKVDIMINLKLQVSQMTRILMRFIQLVPFQSDLHVHIT